MSAQETTAPRLIAEARFFKVRVGLELAGNLQDQAEHLSRFVIADERFRLAHPEIHADAEIQFLTDREVEHDATVRSPAEVGVLEFLNRADERAVCSAKRRLRIRTRYRSRWE